MLLSGLPLRDYQAEVCVELRAAGGTLIRWIASFRCALWTGWFWRMCMNRVLAKVSGQLAAAAECGAQAEALERRGRLLTASPARRR